MFFWIYSKRLFLSEHTTADGDPNKIMRVIFWGRGKNEQRANISLANEMEAESEVFDAIRGNKEHHEIMQRITHDVLFYSLFLLIVNIIWCSVIWQHIANVVYA